VLHETYRSYDLANLLLKEFGRRQGRDVSADYLRAIAAAGPVEPYTMNIKQEP
jgi:hypothetical protein